MASDPKQSDGVLLKRRKGNCAAAEIHEILGYQPCQLVQRRFRHHLMMRTEMVLETSGFLHQLIQLSL
jgi:predicted xylose isomerase-like sugar epimerase